MAPRRIRPTRPLAPHGLPGHLVGFVEALRGVGISVGPSETVDAGRVMATLGLSDREVLREGIACAVLRRPDHRETYDAMFDLWFPAALGARAAVTDEGADGAQRRWLVAARRRRGDAPDAAGSAHREPRPRRHGRAAGRDDRAHRGGLRQIQLQPRPVVLLVPGAQGDGSGRIGGQAAGGAACPVRRRTHTHPGADRQSARCATDHPVAQDGRRRDQTAHRRTARPRPRPDVRHPTAFRERRVSACFRRAAAPDATGRGPAGAHLGHPAGGPAASRRARA